MLEPKSQDVPPSLGGGAKFHLGREGNKGKGQSQVGHPIPPDPQRRSWDLRSQKLIESLVGKTLDQGPCPKRRTMEGASETQGRPSQALGLTHSQVPG